MQTSLFHELVVGTPIMSTTYDQVQKSFNRYLPDPATQGQYRTTRSKQGKIFFYFKHKHLVSLRSIDGFSNLKSFNVSGRVFYSIKNKTGRKEHSLSQRVQEHGEYPCKP